MPAAHAASSLINDPLDHPAYRLYRLSNPKLKQYNRNQHAVQLKAPWTHHDRLMQPDGQDQFIALLQRTLRPRRVH